MSTNFVSTFPIEAGLLIRRSIRDWLDRQRFVQDRLTISYHETRGLLNSDFLVRISGPETLVRGWCAATMDMLREQYGEDLP
jgi:hypothetical protein